MGLDLFKFKSNLNGVARSNTVKRKLGWFGFSMFNIKAKPNQTWAWMGTRLPSPSPYISPNNPRLAWGNAGWTWSSPRFTHWRWVGRQSCYLNKNFGLVCSSLIHQITNTFRDTYHVQPQNRTSDTGRALMVKWKGRRMPNYLTVSVVTGSSEWGQKSTALLPRSAVCVGGNFRLNWGLGYICATYFPWFHFQWKRRPVSSLMALHKKALGLVSIHL